MILYLGLTQLSLYTPGDLGRSSSLSLADIRTDDKDAYEAEITVDNKMQLEFIHQDAKNRKLTDVDRRTIRRISRKVGAAARKEKLSESKANLEYVPELHVVPIDDSLELAHGEKHVTIKGKKVTSLLVSATVGDIGPTHSYLVLA